MNQFSLTELLERFDRDLFCKKDGRILRVYHKKGDDTYHVFSLTDTWGFDGSPRDWGYMPVYQKLQVVTDIGRSFELVQRSEEESHLRAERDVKNLTENMAYEMRDAIRKTDVLTHSMDKTKDKRRIYDKRSF